MLMFLMFVFLILFTSCLHVNVFNVVLKLCLIRSYLHVFVGDFNLVVVAKSIL